MKSLNEYINEMLIKNKNANGEEIIYAERDDIDLTTMTADEFVEFMKTDAKEAYSSYKQNHKIMDKILRAREDFINSKVRKATEYAMTKWKTEKKRQEYIDKVKQEATKAVENYYYAKEHGVDFMAITYINIGRPSCSYVDALHLNDNDLKRLNDELKKSKWWKGATGWKFTAHKFNGDPTCDGLYIEPISTYFSWDDYRAETQCLNQSVLDFYKDVTYWGD